MSEIIIIDGRSEETDKENVVQKENLSNGEDNNNQTKKSEEKEENAGESLLSPPRKKLKQDAIAFPVISHEIAVKKLNESIEVEDKKDKDIVMDDEKPATGEGPKENGLSNSVPVSPATTPSQQKKKIVKSPALSKEEREKQRQEKERLKQERLQEIEDKRKQKEDEKKRREEERVQKQAEKEKKELERKVEKEKRENERKEKERLKEEDRKKKEEERKKKEEQRESERRVKEAEREKKEEERKQEDEKRKQKEDAEKKKKEKAANQFRSFFTKKKTVEKKATAVESTETPSRFSTFQVTKDMILAPCVRVNDFDSTALDKHLEKEIADSCSYLEELSILVANNKQPAFITRRQLRKEAEALRKKDNEDKINTATTTTNKPSEESEPKAKRRKSSVSVLGEPTDVVVIDDENSRDNNSSDEEDDEDETSFVEEKRLMKAVFLKFEENTRPPYYGTWSKKTKKISGRRPFKQDTKIFNYDVDSDEEWIDEPGEDCSDNGEEDEDEEEKETEEDQDGFFVPHGYLSDDEGVHDESDDENEANATGGGDNEKRIPLSKEAAEGLREQEKLKTKVNSFEVVFKKKLKPRKPICIGIKFTNNIDDLDPLLKDFAKVSLYRSKGENSSEPAACEDADKNVDNNVTKGVSETPENGSTVPQTVPEEAMPFLLRLVHGNLSSVGKMLSEFRSYWIEYLKVNQLKNVRSNISKKQFSKKMQAITTKAHNAQIGKVCYSVNADVLHQYGMSDLELGTGLIYPAPAISSAVTNKDLNENTTETNLVEKVDAMNAMDAAPKPNATPTPKKVDVMEID